MKAIILAAGKGSRLKPLTNTIPKPLIKIFGKSILEHNLEYIYKNVNEIFIIVKYLKDKIINELGNSYKGTKISYYEQGNYKGTGGAIKGIDIQDDIILLNGDSIFDKNDLKEIFNMDGYGCLVNEVEEPSKYGIFKHNEENFASKIIEKPKKDIGNLANLGVYKFSKDIFKYVDEIKESERGEYEITCAINVFLEYNKFKLITIKGEFIDVGYPWDILTANAHFLNKLSESNIKGTIEEGVTIKGNIVLEEGSVLKSGTYIEGNCYIGKDSKIGPNTYLRGQTIIGQGCKIGNAVEIKNSSIGDKTNIAHLSYIGDSIIGNNVNIGGGFISANLRHDKANIKVPVKGKLTDTGLYKLGIIIGDNCKTGINTSSMPGRILKDRSSTNPGSIIK